jgi:hypothetical protein
MIDMKFRLIIVFLFIGVISAPGVSYWFLGQEQYDVSLLPPLEAFVLDPIEIESVAIWIPADKMGPVINSGCSKTAGDRVYICQFPPTTVKHEKADACPDGIAGLLAEASSVPYKDSLPLTVFNGWQWEPLTVPAYEEVTYYLSGYGGNWESSWEGILTRSLGSIKGRWLQNAPCEGQATENAQGIQSQIDIVSFTSVTTRKDYPKRRRAYGR